ncbi:hypothetical protein Efla_002935 [Eimeria flavescens]
MRREDLMPSPGPPGRSAVQGNPPFGARVLQPIVEERVREVVKERVENRYIEVPQIYYVEKVVEVPQEVTEEKIVQVVKPVKKEVIKYVKKPVFVDKIVEVPEVKYIDKIVEVPRYSVKEKIIEVPKVLVIERIIPVLKSYRKEQINYVEPGSPTPFDCQHALRFSRQQTQLQERHTASGSKGESLVRLPTDTPSTSPQTMQPQDFPQTPLTFNSQGSLSYEVDAVVRKSPSAPQTANGLTGHLFTAASDPMHLNAMSSIK